MVLGERTVGQLWLKVQLAVGSQRLNSFPTQVGPFIGAHDLITAWGDDAFYVTAPATSLMNLRNDVVGSGSANHICQGAEGRLPSPAGLCNQGQVQ